MANNIHSISNPEPDKTLYPDRLLRWNEVRSIVSICRSHAHQLAAKGLFPKPRKLVPNGRASAWVESEIREWVAQRVADTQPDNSDAA
jgi:prophage regulatory protein